MTVHQHPQTQLSLDFGAAATAGASSARADGHNEPKGAAISNKVQPTQGFQLYQFRKAASENTARIYDRIFDSIKHLS